MSDTKSTTTLSFPRNDGKATFVLLPTSGRDVADIGHLPKAEVVVTKGHLTITFSIPQKWATLIPETEDLSPAYYTVNIIHSKGRHTIVGGDAIISYGRVNLKTIESMELKVTQAIPKDAQTFVCFVSTPALL